MRRSSPFPRQQPFDCDNAAILPWRGAPPPLLFAVAAAFRAAPLPVPPLARVEVVDVAIHSPAFSDSLAVFADEQTFDRQRKGVGNFARQQGNWADLTGSNLSPQAVFAGTANRTKIDAIGLFTGQVGYAWNAFLLYAKGGAAVVRDKYDSYLTAPLGPLPTGFSETRWGGVVGVGAEYSFARNWSFAVEYDHLFMGTRDVAMTYDPAFIAALNHIERIRQDVDMVTARINYRFSAPVTAKY
jgi:opacity protein-like surface antigen